jgi:hypothetical protein
MVFEPMLQFAGRNLVHFFADQHEVLDIIFDEYDPKSDSDPLIKDFYGVSPLDIAVQ